MNQLDISEVLEYGRRSELVEIRAVSVMLGNLSPEMLNVLVIVVIVALLSIWRR